MVDISCLPKMPHSQQLTADPFFFSLFPTSLAFLTPVLLPELVCLKRVSGQCRQLVEQVGCLQSISVKCCDCSCVPPPAQKWHWKLLKKKKKTKPDCIFLGIWRRPGFIGVGRSILFLFTFLFSVLSTRSP